MFEAVREFLRTLSSSLLLAKIYPLTHPAPRGSFDKTYESLRAILKEKGELVIGIIGDELAFEKEIFFDLSKKVLPFIQLLKEKGIEKISFRSGAQKEELIHFIEALIISNDMNANDIQKYLSLHGVRNISVGRISASLSTEEVAKRHLSLMERYEYHLSKVSELLEQVLGSQAINYLDLQFAISDIAQNLKSGSQGFLKIAVLKKHSPSTFSHLLDVAILSMYFSMKLGFARDDILSIGAAALFHDIGKIYVASRIIDSDGKLSDEEFSAIKSHSMLGAQILLKYSGELGILPVVVAFEHHLRYDGKGYPKLAFAQKPHLVSLMVSLCDVYDALNKRRSYKRNYPPDLIYNLMSVEKERLFDPELLESFFKAIGVWPVGAIVSLSDKRVAIVREENEDNIFVPKVEIVSPEGGLEYIDLRDTKENLKIERALDSLEEGRDYAHLI
jgi:putative nucleotidyltransferase with HDIG domain